MTPAERIALWADRLRDISVMGLLFSKNIHDETAFRNVQIIAMEMYALATGEPMEQDPTQLKCRVSAGFPKMNCRTTLTPDTGRGYLKPFACGMARVECFSIGQQPPSDSPVPGHVPLLFTHHSTT
jgi:hypothetical protein